MSEARVNRKGRFDRLEERLGRIEETIIRMDATLTATVPHLATKAELADLRTDVLTQLGQKPSHAYLWRFRPSTTWSIQIWVRVGPFASRCCSCFPDGAGGRIRRI